MFMHRFFSPADAEFPLNPLFFPVYISFELIPKAPSYALLRAKRYLVKCLYFRIILYRDYCAEINRE